MCVDVINAFLIPYCVTTNEVCISLHCISDRYTVYSIILGVHVELARYVIFCTSMT